MNANILKNIWADLLEKKLILVAVPLLLLVIGLPMTLAKPGDVTTAAVDTPQIDLTEDGPQIGLTRASTTGFERPPRVNDKRLDPFATMITDGTSKDVAKYIKTKLDNVISPSSGSGGGGTAPTDPGTKEPKPTVDPPKVDDPEEEEEEETERDDVLTILVTKQTDEGGDPTQMENIRTYTPLVDPDNSFLVYVGKTGTGGASFIVSADVKVTGDGKCSPSPQDCRTLDLDIGQTAEFTQVTDVAQVTSVTIVDVETKDVVVTGDEDAEKAARLEAKARRAGAKALKSVLGDPAVVRSLVKQRVKFRS